MARTRQDYRIYAHYQLTELPDGQPHEQLLGYFVYGPEGDYLGYAPSAAAAWSLVDGDIHDNDFAHVSNPTFGG